jgi:hypothetical protein
MGTDLRHIFLRLLDFESVVLFILLLPVHFVTLLVIFLFLVFLRIVSLNYEQKVQRETIRVKMLSRRSHTSLVHGLLICRFVLTPGICIDL